MKRVIVSGYFNPLHGGHLDMIEAAKGLGDYLIVVVNNDKAQVLKKGKVILDEQNRMRLVRSLRLVDEVVLSVDKDFGQALTLRKIRALYPNDELIFANGGDRDPNKHALPENETQSCVDCNIKTVFGIGSHEVEKRDSSTRINQALGHKK
ncbi:MAG TPA: adenylyltransferase/cytidyltransferase family protein [Candidatus Saccharimonadales bacterium]|nr:adenylyltransferase/cytidyltransferase family protein [Candidatus Saccharimonadales bacterium]